MPLTLIQAVQANQYDTVVHLLARGGAPPVTALHQAAAAGNLPLVKLLLLGVLVAHGKNNTDAADPLTGDTALHFAAYRGQTPVVRFLLRHNNNNNNSSTTSVHPFQAAKNRGVKPFLLGASMLGADVLLLLWRNKKRTTGVCPR